MVIRDLTLRSAASFGSFHLIRLLYDEYMFYLIEHKVAVATGKSPIAVMGEVSKKYVFHVYTVIGQSKQT
jgi:regulatory factor X 1/2/3